MQFFSDFDCNFMNKRTFNKHYDIPVRIAYSKRMVQTRLHLNRYDLLLD